MARRGESLRRGGMMLRVLMTADTVGGVWIYALDLVRELGRRGIQVALATMGKPLSLSQRRAARQIPNLELYESSYRLEWMEDPWRDISDAGEWLLKLEQEIQPDLIHLNQYCYGHLPWQAPTLMVAHSDVISWFKAVRKREPGSEWNRYHGQVKAGLLAATLLVAPSQSMAEDIQQGFGPLPAIRVIPNGRDPGGFVESEKKEFVFSVGRLWDEAKNIVALERIAGKLPAPVLCAGSQRGPDGKRIELSAIRCLGELSPEETREYMARALIYALPAKYEPFGLSVLEAAMSGCVLVLGDIPSLRENWQNAALFVSPDDPQSLQDAILYLIENPSDRQRLSKQAKERARFFGIERTASAYHREYRALARAVLPVSPEQRFSTSTLELEL